MRLHKNIRLLALHNFFSDFVLFAPVAILYFAEVSGSYALGMSIFSISYVASALLEVPTGVVSDFMGRRKTLIAGSVFTVLCILFYAIGTSYWMLVVGSLLHGMSIALYSGNNDALLHESLADTNQEHEYHVFLGKTSAMFQVGLALAAIIGSIIAHWSFAWVIWLSLVPQLAALITALFIQEPKSAIRPTTNIYAHMQSAVQNFRANVKLRDLSMVSVLRFSLGETGYYFRNAYIATLWPVWAIGIVGLIAHTGAAASYYFSGKIINRIQPIPVLITETVINRIINFAALLSHTVLSPILMAMSSWMFGVGTVAVKSLMQKEFTENERATMSSLNAFAGSIVFGIFSILLGFVGDRIGVRYALLINHALLLLPLIFYRRFKSKLS